MNQDPAATAPMAPGDAGRPPAGSAAQDPFSEVLERLTARSASFHRYRVHGEVARGGMGVILRVRDEDLHRDLAMKVVRARYDGAQEENRAAGARMLGRFLEEAQVTGQLDHPGIVPVHELGLDSDGRVYFTMRLVHGRDLEKILELVRDEKEGWTLVRAVGAILKVCEAVAYAHDKGVLHRDLKPANIMVGRFGEVYVMDWGLARVLGREDQRDIRVRTPREESTARIHSDLRATQSLGSVSPLLTMDGDVVGTPAFMSPEQARGDLTTIGPASDVYAVGAILYRLLAGQMPYARKDAEVDAIEVWRAVRAGPPEPIRKLVPEAPAELAAICEKAMARDPAARYPGMLQLAEDLRAWLEGRVVQAYERGAFAQVRKWVLRNKALAGTIAVAAGLILIGATTASFILAGKNHQLSKANVQIRDNEKRALDGERRAKDSEEVAKRNAAIADERAARILRLSDVKRLEELRASAESLPTAEPRNIAAHEAWLSEARGLAGRMPGHEKALEEIRRRSSGGEPVAALVAGKRSPDADNGGAAAGTWTFATPEDRWQHDTQQELVEGLRKFGPVIERVEGRLAFARTIEERSVSGPDASARWRAAIASIADEKACPLYGGLKITPQVGLLPIGRDPASGLWEFAHLQSGDPAVRDEAASRLAIDGGTGIVLVLLPGGSFLMGAQRASQAEENFDPQAMEEKESPVHEVTLDPFFMAKFEMTQGQWLRSTGTNPSIYGAGDSSAETHPVEQVSWFDCASAVSKLGLLLPTEAQWEYAARAGTSTPWWTGEQKESLAGAANLADQAAARQGANWPGIADWPELDDGHAMHAPVDAFRPNPFGLYNVHGNVWEVCRDWFGDYATSPAAGDGERTSSDHRWRVSRGGGFYHAAAFARSSYRNNSAPDTKAQYFGLRPSRALTR